MNIATVKKDLENQIGDINKDLKNVYLPHEAVLILLGKRTAFKMALELIDSLQQEQPGEGLDKARFLEVLDKWEEHAIRGMRVGATAYHQGKIALITDLRDWINREG